jgi:hypothetical protein
MVRIFGRPYRCNAPVGDGKCGQVIDEVVCDPVEVPSNGVFRQLVSGPTLTHLPCGHDWWRGQGWEPSWSGFPGPRTSQLRTDGVTSWPLPDLRPRTLRCGPRLLGWASRESFLSPLAIRGMLLWITSALLGAPWLSGWLRFWLHFIRVLLALDVLNLGAQGVARWLERRSTRVRQ